MTNEKKDETNDLALLLADTSDMTDQDVSRFLRQAGVDLDASSRRFEVLLDELFANAAVAEQLSHARRPSVSLLARMESYVRGLHLSTAELLNELQARQFVTAHRDLRATTSEDLESQLAELLALEAAEHGDEQ